MGPVNLVFLIHEENPAEEEDFLSLFIQRNVHPLIIAVKK